MVLNNLSPHGSEEAFYGQLQLSSKKYKKFII
jgi:hypothetical protein